MLTKRRRTLLMREEGLVRSGLVAEWRFNKTNLLLYSEQFDNAAWTATLATVTANQAAAPDGATTAERLQITAAASFIQQAKTFLAGAHTFSVWVKRNAVTNQTFRIRINDGTTITYSDVLTATSIWQQFSISATTLAAAGDVQIRSADDSTAADLFVWGAQLNAGAAIAPYEVTTNNQSILDHSGNGLNLQLGSTANADTNDPVWNTGELIHTTDDYCLSGNLSQIVMAGDWTLYLAGLFDGATASTSLVSLAAPANDTNWVTARYTGAVAGRLQVTSYNGTTNPTSSNLDFPTLSYSVLQIRSASGIIYLTRLDTGQAVSITGNSPAGACRLGVGVLARLSKDRVANTMRSAYCSLYSRAHSSGEQKRMWRYIKNLKAKDGIAVL